MLQLHEVVCYTLFKGGVHLQIFLLSNISYTQRRIMLLICAKTLIQASLVHVLTQSSKPVGSREPDRIQ